MFGLFGKRDPKPAPAKASGPAKAEAPAAPTPAAPPKPTGPVKLKKINVSRRFTIFSETAQGSMSKVYKALDNESGRSVCLKLQDLKKTSEARSRTQTASHRPTEGEIGKAIVHQHVCKTFDFGMTTRGEYYLTMEFIEGPSLSTIRSSRPVPLGERLLLLAQAAEGLAAVHAAGFIHHDIGPKNFLIDERTQAVKLIDFGLAVPNTPEFNKPGNRTGTLNYMAPELLRRETTDERIDVYSFGATMFQMLTGKLPYDLANSPSQGANSLAQMVQRINQPPIDPAVADRTLPEPVCELIRTTLARKREERPRLPQIADRLRKLADEAGDAPKKPKDDDDGFGTI